MVCCSHGTGDQANAGMIIAPLWKNYLEFSKIGFLDKKISSLNFPLTLTVGHSMHFLSTALQYFVCIGNYQKLPAHLLYWPSILSLTKALQHSTLAVPGYYWLPDCFREWAGIFRFVWFDFCGTERPHILLWKSVLACLEEHEWFPNYIEMPHSCLPWTLHRLRTLFSISLGERISTI